MLGYYFSTLVDSLPLFFKGLLVTAKISFLSLVLSTLFGFCLGIARSGGIRLIKFVIACYVDLIRGTPFLVQLFIFFFIFPEWGLHMEAFTAAVLSLTIYGTAYISEIVSSGIEAIPYGQIEAGKASGFNWFQRMRYIIIPQALRPILPPPPLWGSTS